MQEQALYVVDHRGRYQYIWAGSAAEAREKAIDPSLAVPGGAPHQHPKVLGNPRAIAAAAPLRKTDIRTMSEN